jgi:hypothetical protein
MKRQSNVNTRSYMNLIRFVNQSTRQTEKPQQMEGSVNLQTNEHLVAYLRDLRAQGKIAISDSHLAAVRETKMTRQDVERKHTDQLEEDLAKRGVPRGVGEHIVHELKLAILGAKHVYGTREEIVFF